MRRAFTLVELVVTLAVAGVTFSAFTAVVAQQERTHARLVHRIRARGQALEGLGALIRELRSVSFASGDVIAAHDSAIDFRATVATLCACAVREATVVTALASLVSAPKAGDTLWALAPDDTVRWEPLQIATVAASAQGDSTACVAPAMAAGAFSRGVASRNRYLLGFAQPPPAWVRQGTPLHVTRRVRYSLYRAPDGQWYLGRREWSGSLGRFETIQPVSGPYRAHAAVESDESGVELRYVDDAGEQVDPAAVPAARIASVRVTVRAAPPPGDGAIRRRRDVTSAIVTSRNGT